MLQVCLHHAVLPAYSRLILSSPSEWASTVKNHHYWRVIGVGLTPFIYQGLTDSPSQQSHSIQLNDVVKCIEPVLSNKLENSGVKAGDKFIENLSAIVDGEKTSEEYKFLEKLFNSRKTFKDFNGWLRRAEQVHLVVKEGTKWAGLKDDPKNDPITRDTKIQFGVWVFEILKIDVTSLR